MLQTRTKASRGNGAGTRAQAESIVRSGSSEREVAVIKRLELAVAPFRVIGTAPLVIHAFSEKAKRQIMEKHQQGMRSQKGKARERRDYQQEYEQARHKSPEGWDGIPATGFREAMLSVCQSIGFKRRLAEQAIFVEADGYDARDGTPLVRIIKGHPIRDIRPVRVGRGMPDIRSRPMWMPGWEAVVRVAWNPDLFSATDVANLLYQAGKTVGVGEGRRGKMGWGFFRVEAAAKKEG